MPDYSAIARNKLSPEFADRLTQLAPHQKVRAIVLLQVTRNPTGKRQSLPERQAAIQSVRGAAAQSLANIEEIIQLFDGQMLVEHPDVLGSIAIEITAAGIESLAKSDAVKAVIEDCPIQSIQ